MKKLVLLLLAFIAFSVQAATLPPIVQGQESTFYKSWDAIRADRVMPFKSYINFTGDRPWSTLYPYGPVYQGPGAVLLSNGTTYLDVSRPVQVLNGAGNPVNLTAAGKIAVSGLGTLLAKANPYMAAFLVGNALYDLAKELGYLPSKNSDGTVTYQKLDTTVCTVAPCYKYKMSANHGNYPNPLFMSYIETCNAFVEWENIYDTVLYYNNVSVSSNICNAYSWFRSNNQRAGALGEYMSQVTVNPSAPVYTPSTEQAFIDSVANKSGWPSTSKLADAVVSASQIAKLNNLDVPAPTITNETVTGPATSTGTQITKVNPDNTTTTTTDTYNHTYSGNTATTTITSVVSNYNPVTNTTTTTTINNNATTPVPEANQQTDCEKDPLQIGCSHYGDTPSTPAIPRQNIPVTYTPVSFAGGSCPPPVPLTFYGRTYSIPWTPMCDLMSQLQPLFLAIGAAVAAMIFMEGLKA